MTDDEKQKRIEAQRDALISLRQAAIDYFDEQLAALTAPESTDKRCGTCALDGKRRECLQRQREMPWSDEDYHCWKART